MLYKYDIIQKTPCHKRKNSSEKLRRENAMRRLLHFRKWRIRTQIMTSMQALMIVLAISCCVASYSAAKSNIERNYTSNSEKNLQTMQGIMEMKLDEAITQVREVTATDDFLDILDSYNATGATAYDSLNTHRLDEMWSTVENQNDYVSSVFLFDLRGRFYQRHRVRMNTSWYAKYYEPGALEALPWLEEVAGERGRAVFYGYNLLAPEADRYSFTFARQLISPRDFQPVGFLVIRMTPKLFRSSIFARSEFASEMYAVLDADGRLVYSNKGEDYADAVLNAYRRGDESFLFEDVRSDTTGFTTLVSISRADLNGISRYMRVMMPVIIVLSLIVVTTLALLVTRRINRPLEELKTVVTSMKDGEPIEAVFDDGEIGQVGNALKRTVDNNLELRERLITSRVKEREAELLLLQSQINPHFLYNTLDSIYCKAMIQNNDEIAEMVLALSNLFKATLSKGNTVITVREELEHISRYMAIQKLRYGERFELILDVDEELMDLRIIKLILQPFVENSMYHGLEPKIGGGYIEIRGEVLEGIIYFRVTDNGMGMDDPNDIYNGYGVRNVLDRIHLFYGEDYGISVETVTGQKTSVEIRVPVLEDDREGGGEA